MAANDNVSVVFGSDISQLTDGIASARAPDVRSARPLRAIGELDRGGSGGFAEEDDGNAQTAALTALPGLSVVLSLSFKDWR